MAVRAKLIYDLPSRSADLFYACRFDAPDAFAFLQHKGGTALLLNDLELDRGRATARVDRVDALSEVAAASGMGVSGQGAFPRLLAAWLRLYAVRAADVPRDFPLGLATDLAGAGIRLHPCRGGLFWPAREFKTVREISSISAALRIAEAGMRRAMDVLAASRARKNGTLVWGNSTLTAERLRTEIDGTILQLGGRAEGTIAACGDQACDPHGRGTGPLRTNQLIILDIFPQDSRSGYYGDITRTVVKGRASEKQRQLWETCLEGQQLALGAVRPGVDGGAVHEQVKAHFTAAGYPTERKRGRWCGFFHGTGHGLGLEVHEDPRFAATKFQPGQVLTVEPGLYYPGLGGVRHEDVVVVTERGRRILSRFPKFLEIG